MGHAECTSREEIIDLGALVTGAAAPPNGPTAITVYRESRGGAGDTALAQYTYERAKGKGLGLEFDFR